MEFFAAKYCFSLALNYNLDGVWTRCFFCVYGFSSHIAMLTHLHSQLCLSLSFNRHIHRYTLTLSTLFLSHSYGICYSCQKWKMLIIWTTRFMAQNVHKNSIFFSPEVETFGLLVALDHGKIKPLSAYVRISSCSFAKLWFYFWTIRRTISSLMNVDKNGFFLFQTHLKWQT